MGFITHKWLELEYEELSSYTKVLLTNIETKRLVRKLSAHYKIPMPTLKFNRRRNKNQSGLAIYEEFEIRLPFNPNVEIVCHELAHLVVKKGHCKTWYGTLVKLLQYSDKHNYWKK
jgi:hypothetical protein